MPLISVALQPHILIAVDTDQLVYPPWPPSCGDEERHALELVYAALTYRLFDCG